MAPLSPLARRIFFLLAVTTFFVTALAVLFHAFGYRFSQERGIFIYTGSITLETNPTENITVSVDGIAIPEKRRRVLNDSVLISGLAPGEHFIEVAAPGYHSWTKKVIVESGRSTEFWNILLTRVEPVWNTLPRTEHAVHLAAGPENNLLAVVKKQNKEYTVDVVDTEREEGVQVFSTLSPLQPSDDYPLLWSPDKKHLLIPVGTEAVIYFLVDIRTRESRPINDMLPGAVLSEFRFDPIIENTLYFRFGTRLFRVDTSAPASLPMLLSDKAASYDISGRFLYFIESQSGIVYRSPIDRNAWNPTQVTSEPLPRTIPSNPAATLYRLNVYDEQRFAILERPRGRLLVYNTEAKERLKAIGPEGIRSMQFSDDGKKLLFFTDNEISVYFVREWEVQPARMADTQSQIARFSQTLDHVEWARDYEHVLFSLGSDIKVIELDSRDHRSMLDVARLASPPTQIYSRFSDNLIYILAPEEENGTPVVRSLTFPAEPTGFFNF